MKEKLSALKDICRRRRDTLEPVEIEVWMKAKVKLLQVIKQLTQTQMQAL